MFVVATFSRPSARLTSWLSKHLLPEHFLDHPQVVCFAVHNILQLLDVFAELLDFVLVEFSRIRCRLLNVEACPNIDNYALGVR